MKFHNVEIKARCADLQRIRRLLKERSATYVGRDHQVDTYFNVRRGRLKLREGSIERALIYYNRADQTGPARSDILLYQPQPGSVLKTMLSDALGISIVVDKQRDIYFIGNVKFHLDEVIGLGSFVEIEAIDSDGTRSHEELHEQCVLCLEILGITPNALVPVSYSDLFKRNDDTST